MNVEIPPSEQEQQPEERQVLTGEVDYSSLEQLKEDVGNFMVSHGLVDTVENIGYNFYFRHFDGDNISRVRRGGTDRTSGSMVHYEGRERLKELGLNPNDIIYAGFFANVSLGSNRMKGGLAIYDAKKTEGVPLIPHAIKAKQGSTFKDALLAVIKINNAPGKKRPLTPNQAKEGGQPLFCI